MHGLFSHVEENITGAGGESPFDKSNAGEFSGVPWDLGQDPYAGGNDRNHCLDPKGNDSSECKNCSESHCVSA
jgi:hypothetical protein